MSIGRIVGGRYELLERLGSGALFQVFKGRDRVTGRPVAVKMLLPDLAEDAAFCRALKEASRAAQPLLHPNIAVLYELVEEGGLPVLVTEYVRGMDLKERIKRIAPFTASVAVDFAVSVAEALQYAHAEKMLHGDLRPQNIIISTEGAVKVTDFGVAQALATSPDVAARNLARMAPYLAPEASRSGLVVPATDLYALGIILYEMVTGATPFVGENAVLVATRHQTEPVPSARDQNAGVPRALDGIIQKALQKDPQNRYTTAQDMLSDLRTLRDALRFGRSTAWSPTMVRGPAAPETAPSTVAARPTISAPQGLPPPAAPAPSPVLQENPLRRRRDDSGRLPAFLRVSLLVMSVTVLLLAFLGLGLWLASFSKPEMAVFPDLVGKGIEEARREAVKLKIHLIEREEFNDRYDPGTVFRVDYEPGRPIRPGRTVLIWVSKGSRMVWVPDVTNISAPEAEAKLKEAGLTLGTVDRQPSATVPYGHIISQNPRSGKRVERETPVNLVVSDGSSEDSAGTGEGTDLTEHQWRIKHRVWRDGQGRRQVRIEVEDAVGATTVFDEEKDEGEIISLTVPGQGPYLIVRVYYNDDPEPVSERKVEWRNP